MNDLERKFEGYEFEIDIPDREHFEPENAAVEVVLTTRTGERYLANFITRQYEDYLFRKNSRTRECAGGIYLWVPNKIDVEEINPEIVKKVIDDLIKNLEIENAFGKID